MGGSFGGMMLRHAEHINGTAILRANAACEPAKKKMSKASQKLLDELDAELQDIKDARARSRTDAVLTFNRALVSNAELFADAGLVKSGDTLMTILNRVKREGKQRG